MIFLKSKSEVDKIKKNLECIAKKYPEIVSQCMKYIDNNSRIDKNNNINIFHRPWIAPLNWGINLFDSIKGSWIDTFTRLTSKSIPLFYKDFLVTTNGAFVYDISLYGLTPSIYRKGVFSRDVIQCHDLTTANKDWILEYRINSDCFHFGGRTYSINENVGYFYRNNEIICIRTNGELINKWNDFNLFLKDEIEEAEKRILEEVPENITIIKK